MDVKGKQSKKYTSSKINNIDCNKLFSFIDYIDIDLGDPITSLYLNPKFVIIGTMMGKIKLFHLKNLNYIFQVSDNSEEEYISGISFIDNTSTLYASIGDESIAIYKSSKDYNFYYSNSIQIYEDKAFHHLKCDNSYILMATENIIKVDIFNPESEEKITNDAFFDYEVINFEKYPNSKYNGSIKSTNYFIPLDFDGINFCWVEYLNEKKDRNLCIQMVLGNNGINSADYKFNINEKYGHISFAKLMNGNKILIIHDLNKCEIRSFINNFQLLESFTHIGDEVYAVDICYYENNRLSSENLHYNNININDKVYYKKDISDSYTFNNNKAYKNKNDLNFNEIQILEGNKFHIPEYNRNRKIKIVNTKELKTDSLSLLKEKKIIISNDYTQNLAIITLDVDGNVNKFENGIELKLFNLYDIKGINQDHKDKRFFNMGYAYYIKTDLKYFCITTDHGCFIIKSN